MPAQGVDINRVNAIFQEEQDRFHRQRPRSAALLEKAKYYMPNGVPCAWMDGMYLHQPFFAERGEGAYFWDVDQHKYLDMNQADLSMNCGYGPKVLVEAIKERVANGSQFLLPVEDSIDVCEKLSERYRHHLWQFTLSASSANMEAIRIARAYTEKEHVLVFGGKYHGHIDDTMGEKNQDSLGFSKDFKNKTLIVEFNDLESIENALKNNDVACIVTEPALTNIGVILPQENFFLQLRSLCDRYHCLLIIDETHTQVCAWGGLSRVWNIESDMITLGKTVAAGIPTGVYGMSQVVGEFVANHLESFDENDPRAALGGLAIGGTLFGNALSMAAAKVALTEILTKEAYEKTSRLGEYLSSGLQTLFDQHALPWLAQTLLSRSGYTFGPKHPRNSTEYYEYSDEELLNTMRVFYANRGVWEAISSAGPAVSFVMEQEQIDQYLTVVDDFLTVLKN
ncbi:MAG: aminotransferase class III-fold pyridoxal phosphate-dependent enzyme [Gammaproteobacteria bacterium]|nr:aminotransferase class III-fold pyridoxal phosphate-dependent enzyme [Gammaproteobacteria bacterium]